jgi:hypothetical protein
VSSSIPVDPARPLDIRDLNAATVESVIRHLGASSRPEHLVYRESELDALWTLADMATRTPGGGTALEALDRLWTAHDLVGEGRCVEATAELKQLAEELP